MPGATYALFERAIRGRLQVTCTYQGHARELCPHILGWTDGENMCLAFQFGGATSRGPLRRPEWKCLRLAEVRDARLREGPWHGGASHTTAQTCVRDVDLDVNPDSPYGPSRPLGCG